ncbi:hypothetical protein CAP36_10455 [Chitinophagaceae bacterium IBVUCB2]|nr:hypothetical protein CAP36_10455 [Chitinophagaceae bacterium IBVUCB2]
MLQRTKGRLLITLLVVTGLAGTLNDSSVSREERKVAVTLLKEGRDELLERVKDLSEEQLNFIQPGTNSSIKNCLMQINWSEDRLWDNITTIMQQTSNPEKRLAIQYTDEQIVKMTEQGAISPSGSNTFKLANAPWKATQTTISSFKNRRNEHIKYMKSSTEDLRNHVALTPVGWIDCYQYILIMGAETNCYVQQIDNILNHKKFPKK